MKFSIFNNLIGCFNLTCQVKTLVFKPLVWALLIAILVIEGQAASPGAVDQTFGLRGTALHNPSGYAANYLESARAIAVQPDGKIILAGSISKTLVNGAYDYDFIIVRFNSDGTPDNTFGTNGNVFTDHLGQNDVVVDMAVQADGKIVVVGGGDPYPFLTNTTNPPQNVQGFKIFRYMPDGTLDPSFGSGGKVYESFEQTGGFPQTMAIQPDGKIVVFGTDYVSVLYGARFNPNGSLDTSFGTNGIIRTNSYSSYEYEIDLALQPDGKFVLATNPSTFANPYPSENLKLIRLESSGSLDTTFGNAGISTSSFPERFSPVIAIQTDGKILVSGKSSYHLPLLKRFNANGTNDTAFVPNHGEIIDNLCSDCTKNVSKILSLPDGKFYLVGTIDNVSLSVSRYLNDGYLDTTFGFRGTSRFRNVNKTGSLGPDTYYLLASDAVLQPDGKIVLGVTSIVNRPSATGMFAVRITAAKTPPSMRSDFDGDGKTDLSVLRPSNYFWYSLNSRDNSWFAMRYGLEGDQLTPGDYNFDLKTDTSIYRSSSTLWHYFPSQPAGGGYGTGYFGLPEDIRVPEDYDGDGATDIAYFRPSNGVWYIYYSSYAIRENGQYGGYKRKEIPYYFGYGTDKPVPGDYDGDGKADIAVFRPSNGFWYILRSSDGRFTGTQFGISTDKLVPGDYDGDGKTDLAVFRDGIWYILRSSDNGFYGLQFGYGTDKPVPGDYDGDGKYDIAVFRQGIWYVLKSSDSSFYGALWGNADDIPIPNVFVK